jgi:hypothetical protein
MGGWYIPDGYIGQRDDSYPGRDGVSIHHSSQISGIIYFWSFSFDIF